MTEPFIGEIKMVGFNFAPRGYALCSGQLLAISQNTALFSLLGTMYGGNGTTTFALPDLRGRAALHYGQGPGLSNRFQGEVSGSESVSLTQGQNGPHLHMVQATNDTATSKTPLGNYPAFTGGGSSYAAAPNGTMAAPMISPSGNGEPHANMQPYLVVNFIIALEGIFPSRN